MLKTSVILGMWGYNAQNKLRNTALFWLAHPTVLYVFPIKTNLLGWRWRCFTSLACNKSHPCASVTFIKLLCLSTFPGYMRSCVPLQILFCGSVLNLVWIKFEMRRIERRFEVLHRLWRVLDSKCHFKCHCSMRVCVKSCGSCFLLWEVITVYQSHQPYFQN